MFARMPFEVFLAIALMSCGKLAWSGGMMFLIVSVLITLARSAGHAPAARDPSRTPSGVPDHATSNPEFRHQPRGAASQSAPAGVHTPR
jgi:hypothetical protein